MEETEKKQAQIKALELSGIKEPEQIFSQVYQTKFYVDEQPIYYDDSQMWWMWNHQEKKWELTDEVYILNRINEITGEDVITPNKRTLILNSLKQECRKTKPKPIKTTWIQFKDKIVDIVTGKIFDATPEYFVTNPIPYNLNVDDYESTPTMDLIFGQWVGEDYVKTLYEIIAYCLLPEYPLHRIFVFIGEGMNGKSCFLNLIRKFIGIQNICSTELDDLINNRFEKTKLYRKLVCIMGETNFNDLDKTSLLKKLSGGDLIGFEFKNKNPFEDINYAKILIATNNLPTTSDKTIGFYRRWMIIDFPNRFSEQKDILNDIPEEEYGSLALKCVNILHDILKKRKFHLEGSVEERMERFEARSDFLQKFLNDFTVQDTLGTITKHDFYKQFSSWCKENRHRNISETSLLTILKKKGIESEKVYIDWYENEIKTRRQVRAWIGIKWKN